MAPTWMPRSAWTTHGPARALTPLLAGSVRGIAVHWPGTTGPIGDPGASKIGARLEGYRAYHAGPPPVGRGWSDIAYNLAFDQAGRVWDLRGIRHQSAANGDQTVNAQYIAFLLLVGPGERPTPAMIDAVCWQRDVMVRGSYPHAREVRGHRDVRPDPTQCPGDLVEHLVLADAFKRAYGPLKPAPKPGPDRFVLTRYLALGATGRDVAALQRRLNEILADDTRVDGDFGPDTRQHVRVLQRVAELEDDGIVGPATCRPLGWTWKP